MNRVYKSGGKLRQLGGTQAGVNRFRASVFGVCYTVVVGGAWILATWDKVKVREFKMPERKFLTEQLWNTDMKHPAPVDAKSI